MADGVEQRELDDEGLGLSWSAIETKEEGRKVAEEEEKAIPDGDRERLRRAPVATGARGESRLAHVVCILSSCSPALVTNWDYIHALLRRVCTVFL